MNLQYSTAIAHNHLTDHYTMSLAELVAVVT
jgi:hypothetical protein